MPIIAPSLLAANAGRLSEEIRSIEHAGAKYLHIDVMDGHFVPNLSFGPNIVAGIRPESQLYFDVHLMIEHPAHYAQAFIDAGADAITVHAESQSDPVKVYEVCLKEKVGFGLSLCPDTPLERVKPLLERVDILLVMSIHPGFGGQKFMPEAYDRIREAARLRQDRGAHYLISVDGGVNAANAAEIVAAGADILVAGSAVFTKADRKEAIASLQNGGK